MTGLCSQGICWGRYPSIDQMCDWWAVSLMTTGPEARSGHPQPLCTWAPAEGQVPPPSSRNFEGVKGLT